MDSSKTSLDDAYSKIGFGKFQTYAVIILGCFHACNAIEIISMSFIGPILNCVWKITLWESSLITMSMFIGMMFAPLVLGRLNDIYGRKRILMICGCGVFYFSIFCAASPTVIWVIVTKLMIGIFIGGAIPTIITYLTEVLPVYHRGRAMMCFDPFASIGAFYVTLVTFILVPIIGWRLWTLIAIAPMVVVIVLISWLPESPRYLLSANRRDDALKIINRIADINKAEKIENVKIMEYKKASLLDLLHPKYVLTIIIVSYIWFVIGSSHYSLVLISPIINDLPRRCLQDMKVMSNPSVFLNSTVDNSCCVPLSLSNMKTVLIAATGELISYLIAIIVITFMRRKLYLQVLLVITAIAYFLLNLCLSPIFMGILLMFGRGATVNMLGINSLYTSEVFPTIIRGYAMGFCTFFIKLGSTLSPLIVNNIMAQTSFIGGTMFYSSINIVAFLLVFLLPYETKDRSLLEGLEEEIPELQLINRNN